MPRVATVVPDETDLLCEGCGYTLNGLPNTGNCPECGRPIEQSLGLHRQPSEYERNRSFKTFLRTTIDVIFWPKDFFRHLSTRSTAQESIRFASIHLILATLLFYAAEVGHVIWFVDILGGGTPFVDNMFLIGWAAGLPVIYGMLRGLTRLATWLSAIEARYWGMRLPHAVVARGMRFHTAHYFPVGILAIAVVWGYRISLYTGLMSHRFDDIYLYVLCSAVVISAIYLFQTYWIAMRSMMYANR